MLLGNRVELITAVFFVVNLLQQIIIVEPFGVVSNIVVTVLWEGGGKRGEGN